MDNLHDVIRQMEAFGVVLAERDLGRVERFTPGKKMTLGKGGKWFAKFYEYTPAGSHRRLMTGYFGSYKTGQFQSVELSGERMSADQLAALRAQREAQAQAAEARKLADQQAAAESAADLIRRASPTGTSPYLVRKGLQHDKGLRYLPDGTLVIPMIAYGKPPRVVGAQRILADGKKLFGKDTEKQGAACRFGVVVEGSPILVCEGVATALSIREATQRRLPVFAAFDAGNLLPVLQRLRAAHRGHWLLICADDDWQTRNHAGQPDNVGVRKAFEAAQAITRTSYIRPIFRAARAKAWTDFNDVHQAEGLDAVRRQLMRALSVGSDQGLWCVEQELRVGYGRNAA